MNNQITPENPSPPMMLKKISAQTLGTPIMVAGVIGLVSLIPVGIAGLGIEEEHLRVTIINIAYLFLAPACIVMAVTQAWSYRATKKEVEAGYSTLYSYKYFHLWVLEHKTGFPVHAPYEPGPRSVIHPRVAECRALAATGITTPKQVSKGQFPADAYPPPGWYDDPEQPGRWRWWEGRIWTNQIAPIPGKPKTPQSQTSPKTGWARLNRSKTTNP